jgi:NADH/NAD ratio-sensing transcriptional regulator Rex
MMNPHNRAEVAILSVTVRKTSIGITRLIAAFVNEILLATPATVRKSHKVRKRQDHVSQTVAQRGT